MSGERERDNFGVGEITALLLCCCRLFPLPSRGRWPLSPAGVRLNQPPRFSRGCGKEMVDSSKSAALRRAVKLSKLERDHLYWGEEVGRAGRREAVSERDHLLHAPFWPGRAKKCRSVSKTSAAEEGDVWQRKWAPHC